MSGRISSDAILATSVSEIIWRYRLIGSFKCTKKYITNLAWFCGKPPLHSRMFMSPKMSELDYTDLYLCRVWHQKGGFPFLYWRRRCLCTSLKFEIQTYPGQAWYYGAFYLSCNRGLAARVWRHICLGKRVTPGFCVLFGTQQDESVAIGSLAVS